jgi:hypothetical protein
VRRTPKATPTATLMSTAMIFSSSSGSLATGPAAVPLEPAASPSRRPSCWRGRLLELWLSFNDECERIHAPRARSCGDYDIYP